MCPCWWCHEYGDCCRRQLREMSRPGNIYWNFTEIFIEIVEKYLLKRKRNVYWSQVRNVKLPTHKTDEISTEFLFPTFVYFGSDASICSAGRDFLRIITKSLPSNLSTTQHQTKSDAEKYPGTRIFIFTSLSLIMNAALVS